MPQKPSQASSSYSDSHTYIPPHVQEAMTKQMEHMSPAHMKQYAGAFIQQQSNSGRGAPSGGKVTGAPAGYRPVTHLPRKDHFHQYKVHTPGKAGDFLGPEAQQSPQQMTQAGLPNQDQPNVAQTTVSGGSYDFFMSEEQPTKKIKLPGARSSLPIKIGLAAFGIILLAVIFNLAKGIIAGPSNYPYFLSVVQDQKSIMHLSANALGRSDISRANVTFAATAQAALTSSNTSLMALLVESGKKVKPEETLLKISSKTDQALITAASSGTYNSAFSQVMNDQMATYLKDLNTTYNKTTAKQARDLIADQLHQAELLNELLSQAANTDSTSD